MTDPFAQPVTVVVASPDRHTRERCTRVLEQAGYCALPACDGGDAVAALLECCPVDAVLADPALPGLGALARYAEAWIPRIPVMSLPELPAPAAAILAALAPVLPPAGRRRVCTTCGTPLERRSATRMVRAMAYGILWAGVGGAASALTADDLAAQATIAVTATVLPIPAPVPHADSAGVADPRPALGPTVHVTVDTLRPPARRAVRRVTISFE